MSKEIVMCKQGSASLPESFKSSPFYDEHFHQKRYGGSLKTNSLLGTLMRRYVPEVAKATIGGACPWEDIAKDNPDENPVGVCPWNDLTRIEQGEEWLRSKDKYRCPCTRESEDGEIRKYKRCENDKCWHWSGTEKDNRSPYASGIVFPQNIVLHGKYGSGKTTLAMQLAAACAEQDGISVVISFESYTDTLIERYISHNYDPKKIRPYKTEWMANQLFQKMKEIDNKLKQVKGKPSSNWIQFFPNDKGIDRIFCRPEWVNLIFISLTHHSPKDSDTDCISHVAKTSQFIIDVLKHYNEVKKLIVFDSFNARFDECGTPESYPKRSEIHKLMSDLREGKIIGVFPLEDRQEEGKEAVRFTNDVKYEADCVINLEASAADGNEQTYLEIEKNRDFKHVFGKHLYKISEFKNEKNNRLAQRYLKVFPHLHYVFSTYTDEGKPIGWQRHSDEINLLGDEVFDNLLPQRVVGDYFAEHYLPDENPKQKARPEKRKEGKPRRVAQAIALYGGGGLYKSDIAINSLFYGLCDGENGLIIRLNDGETIATHGALVSRAFFTKKIKPFSKEEGIAQISLVENSKVDVKELVKDSKVLPTNYKYKLNGWDWENVNKGVKLEDNIKPMLVEMVFSRAAIQPEEWLDFVLSVIKKYKIKRVALVDLKFMGVSYKSLARNTASDNMLLPTFTRAMRNIGVDSVICMSDDGSAELATETARVCALANASIKFTSDTPGFVRFSGSQEAKHAAEHGIHLTNDDGGKGTIVIKTKDNVTKTRHEHFMYSFA